MKSIIAKVIIIGGILAGIAAAVILNHPAKTQIAQKNPAPLTPSITITSAPAITTGSFGEPAKLSIPALSVNNVTVETVGKDSQGRMDIPQNVTDVAWYSPGPKPGENGSAVIDGHFDTVTGAPSVFYNLKNLKIGDEIDVVDQNGSNHKFSVTKVTAYPLETFPSDIIFAANTTPHLNLITCGGSWDKSRHQYSQRVVVFSDLVK